MQMCHSTQDVIALFVVCRPKPVEQRRFQLIDIERFRQYFVDANIRHEFVFQGVCMSRH